MATVCSNTSSSSNSSISNSSSYKLADLLPKYTIDNTTQNEQLTKESFTIDPTKITNTAHSAKLNENSFYYDDLANKNLYLNSNFNNLISNKSNDYKALRIKVKSIENHLLPLVNQISTLVNFKESFALAKNASQRISLASNQSSVNSEKTATALLRVGDAVCLAVERFVDISEKIAYENATVKMEMLDACKQAKNAGIAIKVHTQIPNSVVNEIGVITNNYDLFSNNEKFSMMHAANNLLNSVTKVLLLADIVVVNRILKSKNKASLSLAKLENATDLNNFLAFFTQYGDDLVELARLSGERQNDLKDEKRRSQLSSSRWILEKSPIMILYSSKTYLQHMECECAKENVGIVFNFINQALESLHQIVIDSSSMFDCAISLNNNTILTTSIVQISFLNAYRQFEDALELAKNNMITESNGDLVFIALGEFIDSTQDFTDSLYINNDQRERIIRLQNEIREQTLTYLREENQQNLRDSNNNNTNQSSSIGNYEQKYQNEPNNADFRFNRLFNSSSIINNCDVLKKLLQAQTMQLANILFRENQDATLLNCLKTYSLSNHYDLLVETLDKFKEYSDHVLEICKLLRHISSLEIFEVTCEHHYNVFENLSKMIQSSAGITALYPSCKSSNDNLYLYCESWENQINDLSILVKEMQELMNGTKSHKSVYLSLPRPGKHGASNSRLNPTSSNSSQLDLNEQAKMAKLGLEMKLIQNEIETEAEKWNEPQNEIVKLAKSMSEMACEIHLFTRGEGTLKTTKDLFAMAEIFLQHGVLLYGIIKEFLILVPCGYLKDELVQLLDKLPFYFKQLKNRVKQITFGKTATFNKVDWVIQDTRDFTNLVVKLVTSCFLCSSKYNINYEETRAGSNRISNLENMLQNLRLQNLPKSSNPSNYSNHLNYFLSNDQITTTPNLGINHSLNSKPIITPQLNQHLARETMFNLNNMSSNQRYSTNLSFGLNDNRSDSCGPEFRANSLQRYSNS